MKKVFSILVAIAMVAGLIPGSVFAAEAVALCEHHAEHTAECGYAAGESECTYVCEEYHGEEPSEEPVEEPRCYCAEHCTADNFNEYCDVCGFDYTACIGEDTAAAYALTQDANGVYQIATADELFAFAALVNSGNLSANAKLTNNIVVNENVLKADGTLNEGTFREWTPIGNQSANSYDGTFDGQNHTISGLYFNDSSASTVGLFGYAYGTVQNVGVIESYISADYHVGGVVGSNNGTITNCYNTGSVIGGSHVGGVAGGNNGTITDCCNNGSVIGSAQYVGGLVGANSGPVSNCCNTGIVTGWVNVGGVVGYLYSGNTVTNCYNTGRVTGNSYYAGGIVGYLSNSGTVINCSNTGIVTCERGVGGVVGCLYSKNISDNIVSNCHNTGSVTSIDQCAGGIVGDINGGTVTNCYNNGIVTGNGQYVGGIGGELKNGDVTNCYYIIGTAVGGINGADAEGQAEAKSVEQLVSGEVAYLLGEAWGQEIGTETYPVLGGEKVYYGYISCAEDAQMVYTNNANATAEIPEHTGPFTAVFDWPENTTSLYMRVSLNCTCGEEMDYSNVYGESYDIVSETEGTDCQHPSSVTYSVTVNLNEQDYTETKTYYLPSENHAALNADGFCSACGEGIQPAVWDEEAGIYEIYTAGQLFWFANYVNNENNDVRGKLMNDITVPEGKSWNPIMDFYGTFDGNFMTVSGLYVKSEGNEVGMFGGGGYSYGTIKNLHLTDSYFEGAASVGGIAGSHSGTIENCYVDGTVTAVGEIYTGTLVGNMSSGDVTNCYAYSDTLIGFYNRNYVTVENSYYLSETETEGGGKTAAQFASGEVAYLLQGEQEEQVWGQKLGENGAPYPSLSADQVYQISNCKAETAYSNTNENIDHINDDGICSVCNQYQPAVRNAEGVYEIGNAGQLYWFADKVNNDNEAYGSADAILIDNIVVNKSVLKADGTLNEGTFREWTPIGTQYVNSYGGTFDGQNHTISGLYLNDSSADYVGLFGRISAYGTVQNVGLIDNYFSAKNYAGGIAGYIYYGIITNCYNTGSISGGEYYAGGIVGYNDYGIVTDCYNTGTITGKDYVGGIVGHNCCGTVTNCYNTGSVTGSERVGGVAGNSDCYNFDGIIANCYNTGNIVSDYCYAGGIVGYNSLGTITDCYNTGSVICSDDYYYYYADGIVGYNSGDIITNCYYLTETDDGFGGKTAEQFASGEVAYLLQGDQEEQVWGQKINTDLYPVHGGDKVYISYTSCAADQIAYTNNEEEGNKKPAHSTGEEGDKEATCIARAYCSVCKAEYGELNPDNHISNSYDNHGMRTCCGAYQPAVRNADGVYEIGNAGQLYWFASEVNRGINNSINAVLIADIVVNENVLKADGTLNGDGSNFRTWTPIGDGRLVYYFGTFDGQNHTISGLYFNDSNVEYVGLFGRISTKGTVRNVGVIDSYFSGAKRVGGIVGYLEEATVTNCYNTGTVTGSEHVGGVVGYAISNFSGSKVIIENCCNNGSVSSNDRVGGVVGNASINVIIENCCNNGSVSGQKQVGGVVGYSANNAVTNCYNNGSVSGDSFVGGVMGNNKIATNCYNTGSVSGNNNVGGVAGYNSETVINCYNIGAVDGQEHTGGVVGYNAGTVINCYNIGTMDGQEYTGGVVGYNAGATITNCYYLSETDDGTGGKTAEQFASGEVAYLLQGEQEEQAWGQKLGENGDTYPILSTDRVYKISNCKAEIAYSNTNEDIGHIHVNGVCSVCGDVCSHSYTAAFDWAADCSLSTVTASCGVCKDKKTLDSNISSRWDAETDTVILTASADLNGETFTDTRTIKLELVGGKLTVTGFAAGADEKVDMVIMVAGYTSGKMTGFQIIDSVTGVTEKTLSVTGDTLKVFFLTPGTYAPLFVCAQL